MSSIKMEISAEALFDILHEYHHEMKEQERVGKDYDKLQTEYDMLHDDYQQLILDNQKLEREHQSGEQPLKIDDARIWVSLKAIINGIYHQSTATAIGGIRAITNCDDVEARKLINDCVRP